MKLTDTQLVLLSGASKREDRTIELAPNLKGAASHKVVHKLLREGLIEESGTLPVWRHDDNSGAIALRITNEGLAAVRVDEGPIDRNGVSDSNETTDTPLPDAAPAPTKNTAAGKAAHKKGSRPSKPKSGSKQDRVIGMLQRPQGTTIAAIEGNGMAAALGPRLLRSGGRQKASPDA
jgi:hypothetical protein